MRRIELLAWMGLMATIMAFSQTRGATAVQVRDLSGQLGEAGIAAVQTAVESLVKDTLVERHALGTIMAEQALSLSGATNRELPTGLVTPADKIILVEVNRSGPDWLICMRTVDTHTGTISDNDCRAARGNDPAAAVAGASVLAGARTTSVRSRLEVTVVDPHVTVVHKRPKGTRTMWVPCRACGGSGKLNGQNCPACNENYRHQGPDTHGRALTGSYQTVY